MAKALLTCFAPFKPLSPNELAVGLFPSLVTDVQQLQKSLEENPPSLRWCSEAMSVIRKTHSHFLLYFERSGVPASRDSVNMLDEYMKATLDLLDLCNLLKSAVLSIDRYRMMIDFMVKRLEDASFSTVTSKIELERLETEKSNKLYNFRTWRVMNLDKEEVSKVKLKTRTNVHVLQAIRSTMSIISLFMVCSILHPISIKIDEGFYTEFRDFDSFSDSMQKLVVTFGERFQCVQGRGKPVLHENEMIGEAFAALKATVFSAASAERGNLPESVDMLKDRSRALKEGIDLFESVVNELFEDVIKGRKKLIDLITINNYIV